MTSSAKKAPPFYNAQSLGRSLKEVSTKFIKAENQKIRSEWYHSTQDADLFLFRDQKDRLIKQQLSLFGQIVEWNILDGVKTGMVIEEIEHAADMGASEIIRFDREPNDQAIRQAMEVLAHIEEIPADDREMLKANLMSPWAIQDERVLSETEKLMRVARTKIERPAKKSKKTFSLWQWLSKKFFND